VFEQCRAASKPRTPKRDDALDVGASKKMSER
jgi:hypothetical protein